MSDIKRTWSVPTSPRNPYKLSDELGLLQRFEGQRWNKKTQRAFAECLAKSNFFEGSIYAKEPDFSARDRINRSPKTFGFVRFDKHKIEITPAGKQLIAKENLEDLFLRQLLKWQYPSPKHEGEPYSNFKIKPFLEILRLVYELKGLTKRELAIFGVTFIDYRKYDSVKKEIMEFRQKYSGLSGREKKEFLVKFHIKKFEKIYLKEIKQGLIKTREKKDKDFTVKDFILTKFRNSIDYADAAIRYFRATGLFTISARTFRLEILDTKETIVKQILKEFKSKPSVYSSKSTIFLDFLGNPDLPALPQDDKDVLVSVIIQNKEKLINLGETALASEKIYKKSNLQGLNIAKLKELKSNLENKIQSFRIDSEILKLQSYVLYQDIIEVFNKIQDRTDVEIPDKPLFFEWNTWRALNMLDDGEIKGNLILDQDGQPLHTAPGKMPDIVCFYKDFVLIVEVTLMSGFKQYEAEGEPVARHLGEIKKILQAKGDSRPIYGVFITPKVNSATAAHFYMLRKTKISFYGGKTRIIPLDLESFLDILKAAKLANGLESSSILRLVSQLDEMADKSKDENHWYEQIVYNTQNWKV